jgi:hypothetical protein
MDNCSDRFDSLLLCWCGCCCRVCPQSPLGVLKNCVLCSTLCIIERGSNNSREARRVDFVGLCTNDARIVSTHSSLTPGPPLLLRSWTLPGNAVASPLLHSHSEVAYWTVCSNFVESEWLILSQKAIPHKARVPAQSPFHKQLTEKRKDGRLFPQ